MKAALPLFLLVFLTLPVLAQEVRYETATGTNAIQIAEFETGELITVLSTNYNYGSEHITVQKNNLKFPLRASASQLVVAASSMAGRGDTVRGPATFYINNPSVQGFTIKITPVSFPPNQTAIVPPGTNQVVVSLESSTNLVNWAAATNGVYGSPDSANFFRIRMTKLQP